MNIFKWFFSEHDPIYNLGKSTEPRIPPTRGDVLAEFYLDGLDQAGLEIARLKKALALAMYYIEGDATYEAVKVKIDKILAGIESVAKDDE